MSGQGVHHNQLTPGERIVAVSSTGEGEDSNVYIFGYGIYQCDEIAGKEAAGPVSALSRYNHEPVPKIQLDDGNIIWGSECHVVREEEFQEMVNAPGIDGVKQIDLIDVRAKAPNVIVVKFFLPPKREIYPLPVKVSNDTFRMMRALESLGRDLHLEGEYLRKSQQMTVTLSDNREDIAIEIVTSLNEPYEEAIRRLIERAHIRLMASS